MNFKRSGLALIGITVLVLMGAACFEDVYYSEEEKPNENMVGVWYRYYIQMDTLQQGLSSLTQFNEDGSGTSVSVDDTGQVELTRLDFLWSTTDNVVTVSDENDSVLWSGVFTFQENKGVLQLDYTRDNCDVTEVFIRYTGDNNTEMIGKWIMVIRSLGGERQLSLRRLVLLEDKTGTDYLIPDLEDTALVETAAFYWNTSGNYLIMIPEGEQTAIVTRVSLRNDRLTNLSNDQYGIRDSVIYVKDASAIDSAALGAWRLSSWKIDGVPWPTGAQTRTLYLYNTGRGAWETVNFQGTYTEEFNWSTTGGYMFLFRDSNPDIAWVHTYVPSDSAMTLKSEEEYIQGYGWATVEYSLDLIAE